MGYIIRSGTTEFVYLVSVKQLVPGLGNVPIWSQDKSEAIKFKTKLQANGVKKIVSCMKSTKVLPL